MSEEMQHSIPEWMADVPEGDFISYLPSYVGGKYLDLFDEYSFSCKETGDITYYLYDPVKHGADKNGKYPVLVFIHGMGNSSVGKVVVNYSSAELYASPDYQATIGGAYIIVPVCNEKFDENGECRGSWNGTYSKPLVDIKNKVVKDNKKNIGKVFFFGTSAGAFMIWTMLPKYYKEMDVAVPIAGGNIPDDKTLAKIEKHGTQICIMHGRHDELVSFQEHVGDREAHFKSLSNFTCYFPEWVRNGDGGIAQLDYGLQMGQHCLNNQVQANLIYDNGEPYDALFPEGVTGWIRDMSR